VEVDARLSHSERDLWMPSRVKERDPSHLVTQK